MKTALLAKIRGPFKALYKTSKEIYTNAKKQDVMDLIRDLINKNKGYETAYTNWTAFR